MKVTLEELDPDPTVLNDAVKKSVDDLTTTVTARIMELSGDGGAWRADLWQYVRDTLDATGAETALLATIKSLEVETYEHDG